MAQDETVYNELISFLKSDRADLRLAASEAVLGITDEESTTKLIKNGIIQPLCKLSSRSSSSSLDDLKTSTNALEALVYLSSSTTTTDCIDELVKNRCISRMTEIALSNPSDMMMMEEDKHHKSENLWKKRINYSLALLVNMTRTESGCIDLCGLTMPEEAVPSTSRCESKDTKENDDKKNEEPTLLPSKPTMTLLTSRFLSHTIYSNSKDNDKQEETEEGENDNEQELKKEKQDQEKPKDNEEEIMASNYNDCYQHFAAVLMNATQIEQGRRFVMKLHHSKGNKDGKDARTATTSVLQRILPQLRSKSPIRRRYIAGTIKNCCFDKESAWWLINTPEINIIPKLLYPLAGPEELDLDEKKGMDPDLWLEGPDKEREMDEQTRLFLVDCLLLLCVSGRISRQSIRLQRAYVILKFLYMVEESEPVSDRIDECVQYLRRDEEGTKEGSSDLFVEEAYQCGDDNNKGGTKKVLTLPAPTAAKSIGTSEDNEDEYDDVD